MLSGILISVTWLLGLFITWTLVQTVYTILLARNAKKKIVLQAGPKIDTSGQKRAGGSEDSTFRSEQPTRAMQSMQSTQSIQATHSVQSIQSVRSMQSAQAIQTSHSAQSMQSTQSPSFAFGTYEAGTSAESAATASRRAKNSTDRESRFTLSTQSGAKMGAFTEKESPLLERTTQLEQNITELQRSYDVLEKKHTDLQASYQTMQAAAEKERN